MPRKPDKQRIEASLPVDMVDLVDNLRMSLGLTRSALVSVAVVHFCAELAAVFPVPKRQEALSKLDKLFRAALARAQNAA